MGFITLDDRSGRIEASLFAEAFNSAQALLQTDALVVVEGEVSNDDFSGGLRLRAKRVMSLEERSEEHTSELQSLMRISYAVFCLKNTTKQLYNITTFT